jgi:hypothetical protein
LKWNSQDITESISITEKIGDHESKTDVCQTYAPKQMKRNASDINPRHCAAEREEY